MTRAMTACRATPFQSDTAHIVSTYACVDMSDAADDEIQPQSLGSAGGMHPPFGVHQHLIEVHGEISLYCDVAT